jgi:hypothetical protein
VIQIFDTSSIATTLSQTELIERLGQAFDAIDAAAASANTSTREEVEGVTQAAVC